MLVAAISGGAAIPPMTGAVATRTGNFHTAMAIPTSFYVLAWVFPIYANLVSKKILDGHRRTDLNITQTHTAHAKGMQLEDKPQESKGTAENVETVAV